MAIKDLSRIKCHLFMCNGGTCKMNGAEETTAITRQLIKDYGMWDQIHTTKTLCNGRCEDGPIVIVQPENKWYKNIYPDYASTFVLTKIIQKKPVKSHELFCWNKTK